jgi:hypothetical protein
MELLVCIHFVTANQNKISDEKSLANWHDKYEAKES